MARRGFIGRGSKFNARRVVREGIKFDSKAEADRYAALLWLEKAGQIRSIERQPAFPLVLNGVKVASYRGDFAYTVAATGERVVEDVKGFSTPVYKLKKRMVAALFGVEIAEVSARDADVKAIPVTTTRPTTRRRP